MSTHQAPKKIAIAGDWHANSQWAITAIREAHAEGIDTILHLGDFGIWRGSLSYLLLVKEALEQYDMRLYFVDGNHEDFPYLYTFPIDEDGFRAIYPRMYHIPRGHTWEWSGVRFMGLGGAYSIDRMYRKHGISWFIDECITDQDVDTAIENGSQGVDVLLSHDAPDGFHIPLNNGFVLPEQIQMESYMNRQQLGRVVDAVKPKVLLHGHYHLYYSAYREHSATRIVGLDCDNTDLEMNVLHISMQDLTKLF